jgi:hypothetical protein
VRTAIAITELFIGNAFGPLSGGGKTSAINKALELFAVQTDLLGYRNDWSGQSLILVIYVDALSPADVVQRCNVFFEASEQLARFGSSYNWNRELLLVYSLWVYFDPQRYQEASGQLVANAWRSNYSERRLVWPGFIDAHNATYSWSDMPTGWRVTLAPRQFFARKTSIFDEQDLKSVLVAMPAEA